MKISRRGFLGLLGAYVAAAFGWKTVRKQPSKSRAGEGLRIRIVHGYDFVNDRMIHRMDVLFGFGSMSPQMGCAVTA